MYKVRIYIEELSNGHAKLIIENTNTFTKEGEFPSVEEALDEGYKHLAREKFKWKS